MLPDYYTEEIVSLAKDTKYQRGLADATHSHVANNPLCGDKLKLEIVVKNNKIIDGAYTGEGCVIMKASATTFIKQLIELDTRQAIKNCDDFLQTLQNQKEGFWQQIAENPSRTKCVTLAWHAGKQALQDNKTAVIKILKTIRDPELPVNIYELGLIYDVIETDENTKIIMTLTTPNCPVADSFPGLIENKIKQMLGDNVKVELTFDPPWTIDRASADARILLGF